MSGNVVANTVSTLDQRTWKFDVAGRVADWVETSAYGGTTRWDQGERPTFDGDGRTAKRLKRSRMYASPPTGWYEEPEYSIYSSVTGQKMVELDQSGQWTKRNIYMGSTVIAEHTSGGTAFKHTDPVTASVMQTNPAGEIEAYDVGRVEHNALGDVLATQPPELQEPPHNYGKGGSTSNPGMCAGQEVSALGPMPCRPSQAFMNYLTGVYGLEMVGQHFRPDVGLGGGGVGADNESMDGRRVRGLRLVPDKNGFAIKGFDFRFSWVMSEDFSGDPTGSDGPDELESRNPCARMARRAQKVADEVIQWRRDQKKTWDEARDWFDRSFTPYYIGRIWVDSNVWYFWETDGGVPSTGKRLPREYGQEDFKNEFLDAEATRFTPALNDKGEILNGFNSDQVHHFVGLFSAGMNNSRITAAGQDIRDAWASNPGDIRLGQAAFEIGSLVRKNPLKGLTNIGDTIRTRICR